MAWLSKERNFTKFIRDDVLSFSAGRATMKRVLRGDHQSVIDAYRYVVPFHPKEGWEESAYMVVGGLMAIHPRSLGEEDEEDNGNRNFGHSMALLANRTYGAGPDRRFTTLLGLQSFDVLRSHLHTLVTLLKREGVGVDWPVLLHDLVSWDSPDRDVQKRWAHSYHSALDQALNR